MSRDASAGFTVIEMLVAAVMLAILAAIAFPSYGDHVRRGRIAEATGKLAAMRIQLEQYYQDHRNYGATAGGCGIAAPAGDNFSFSCDWGSAASDQGYRITATGIPGRMTGFVYSIDQDGSRKTVALPSGWGTPPYDCWILSKGSGC